MNNGRTSPPIKSTPDNMHLLIKHDFAIAGMHQSPHGSGNRAIIHVDKIKHTVYVLLVYHKTDLADGNETAQWQRLVKDGCGEYIAVFDLPSL
ncbi:MAG: hypothetical protein LBM21_03350 [Coriobacteriales bacterium]|nr:hypothetical protein [Coriobacteriales bacterium]